MANKTITFQPPSLTIPHEGGDVSLIVRSWPGSELETEDYPDWVGGGGLSQLGRCTYMDKLEFSAKPNPSSQGRRGIITVIERCESGECVKNCVRGSIEFLQLGNPDLYEKPDPEDVDPAFGGELPGAKGSDFQILADDVDLLQATQEELIADMQRIQRDMAKVKDLLML